VLISLGVLLAALPSTEYLGAAAAAIVGCSFAAAGVGYPLYKKKRTCADIKAFEAMEQARKGTTLAALDDAHEQIRRLQELNEDHARRAIEKDRDWRALVAAKDELLAAQMVDTEKAKAEAERVRNTTVNFVLEMLHGEGMIRKGEGDESGVPAGTGDR
jgi:hypothetical protein